MKKSPAILHKNAKRRNFGFSRQTSVFLFCVMLATVFWLSIKLSKTYTIKYSIKIQYVNVPVGLTLMNGTDTIVSGSITDQGYKLLPLFLKTRMPEIKISINKLLGDFFNTSQEKIKKSFSVKRLLECTVNQVNDFRYQNLVFSADSIQIDFCRLFKKRVPVKHNVKLQLQHQYMLTSLPEIKPDSVTVTGCYDCLKEIDGLETYSYTFSNLNQSFSELITIKPPFTSKNLTIFPPKIIFKANIEEYTEVSLEVPISLPATIKKANIRLFPSTLQIKGNIPLRDYAKVTPDMFKIEIIAEELNTKPELLHYTIVEKPTFFKITSISPAAIEYIVVKP